MKFLKLASVFCTLMLFALTSHATNWSELNCGPNWGPTKNPAPTYPRRAQQRGIEGYIIMSFSINAEGAVEDIQVVEAEPAAAFVRSATRAVEGMTFPPCIQNGLATRQTKVSVKYDFNLAG